MRKNGDCTAGMADADSTIWSSLTTLVSWRQRHLFVLPAVAQRIHTHKTTPLHPRDSPRLSLSVAEDHMPVDGECPKPLS